MIRLIAGEYTTAKMLLQREVLGPYALRSRATSRSTIRYFVNADGKVVCSGEQHNEATVVTGLDGQSNVDKHASDLNRTPEPSENIAQETPVVLSGHSGAQDVQPAENGANSEDQRLEGSKLEVATTSQAVVSSNVIQADETCAEVASQDVAAVVTKPMDLVELCAGPLGFWARMDTHWHRKQAVKAAQLDPPVRRVTRELRCHLDERLERGWKSIERAKAQWKNSTMRTYTVDGTVNTQEPHIIATPRASHALNYAWNKSESAEETSESHSLLAAGTARSPVAKEEVEQTTKAAANDGVAVANPREKTQPSCIAPISGSSCVSHATIAPLAAPSSPCSVTYSPPSGSSAGLFTPDSDIFAAVATASYGATGDSIVQRERGSFSNDAVRMEQLEVGDK